MLETSSPGAKSVKLNPSSGVGGPLAPIQAETPKLPPAHVPIEPPAPVAKPAEAPPAIPATSPQSPPEKKKEASFAALAKQQKALWDSEQRLRAATARATKAEADLRAERERIERARKGPPLDAVREMLGYSYDDLTQAQLSGGERPPSIEVKEVKGEIEQLRKQREEDLRRFQAQSDKAKADAAARANAEADEEMNSWAEGVNEFVRSNEKDYKTTLRAIKSGLINEY